MNKQVRSRSAERLAVGRKRDFHDDSDGLSGNRWSIPVVTVVGIYKTSSTFRRGRRVEGNLSLDLGVVVLMTPRGIAEEMV